MKNIALWQPTKFVRYGGKLWASREVKEVGVYSRMIADLVAEFYDQALPKYCRGALVDLGCGKVPFYAAYKDVVDEVTCVDWPNSPHGVSYLDYECDINAKLPFADACFDTILLSDVLEHLWNPATLWCEMNRILKPGGHIILNTPFYYWLHEEPFDFYRYTIHAMRRFAVEQELEIVLLEPIGGAIEVLSDVLSKTVFYSVPWVGKPMTSALQAMTGIWTRTSVGRSVRKRTGVKFPLGYAMVVRKPVAKSLVGTIS